MGHTVAKSPATRWKTLCSVSFFDTTLQGGEINVS